jgi:hypothetical protein
MQPAVLEGQTFTDLDTTPRSRVTAPALSKIYNATSSPVSFENKNIFFKLKKRSMYVAYNNDDVVVVNSEVSIASWIKST